jgi:hypothetical protein
MAKPSSRDELKEYCLRKLGKPVLEINVDDDQISDCIDDGLQYFQERHYDGVIRMYLKYQFTDQDIARFKSSNKQITDVDGQIVTVSGIPSDLTIGREIFVQGQFDPKGILEYWNPKTNQIGILLKDIKNKFTTSDIILDDVSNLNVTNVLDKTQLQTLVLNPIPQSTQSLANVKIQTVGVNDSGATGVVNGNILNTGLVYFNTTTQNVNLQLDNEYIPFKVGDTVTLTGLNGTFTVTSAQQTLPKLSEALNYIEIPDWIIGINKIHDFLDKSSMNIFDIRYQFRLNDLYDFSSAELLYYESVKTRLEFLYFILEGSKMVRFNRRLGRLYLDLDFASDIQPDNYIILDCYRLIDPSDSPRVWNDFFLKRYVTALIKKQWGQNLIKYQGVQLPGGLTLNGRELYDDATNELKDLEERMDNYQYSEPPLDMIG